MSLLQNECATTGLDVIDWSYVTCEIQEINLMWHDEKPPNFIILHSNALHVFVGMPKD